MYDRSACICMIIVCKDVPFIARNLKDRLVFKKKEVSDLRLTTLTATSILNLGAIEVDKVI